MPAAIIPGRASGKVTFQRLHHVAPQLWAASSNDKSIARNTVPVMMKTTGVRLIPSTIPIPHSDAILSGAFGSENACISRRFTIPTRVFKRNTQPNATEKLG